MMTKRERRSHFIVWASKIISRQTASNNEHSITGDGDSHLLRLTVRSNDVSYFDRLAIHLPEESRKAFFCL